MAIVDNLAPFVFVHYVVDVFSNILEVCTASIFRVTECGSGGC
jgi:hypothetical protein